MILIDNNLSSKLTKILENTYPGIVHVMDLSLDDAIDMEIWNYASSQNLHILTKDSDFNDIQRLQGHPPKVIWIRSGNVPTPYIGELLISQSKAIKEFIENPAMAILEIQ